MEDEGCDCLDKMKLTTEEEETIAISDEGRKEAIESCHLCLIGKFLMRRRSLAKRGRGSEQDGSGGKYGFLHEMLSDAWDVPAL